MSFFALEKPTPIDQKQSRLMQLAALFLLIFSIVLTLSPAARLHGWDVEYRWNHWIGFTVWLIGSAITNHQLARRAPERDPFLFPTAALLSGWGLLTIWRLDAIMGARQTIWLAVVLLVFSVGLRVPALLVFLRRYKYLWLTSGLLLTALTFLFGTYPGGEGPHLWLGCCGVYLQPSEPLKLLLIIYLAAYLSDRLPISFSLIHLLTPTLILIGAALALLIVQRDLGTASLFILIYSVVVYVASNRKRMLLLSLLILMAAGAVGYFLFDVVRIRVDAWLNPWIDPTGRSYQIVQSLLAIASGGLLGRGPGLGSPGVVPVSHSDFIFASIAEETGLLGVIALLGLFALLMMRGFRSALLAPSNYRRYLAAGVSSYLVIQGIFIIGGNLRLLPLTGVTLPFVSYGGSSLLTAYFSLLLLMIISNRGEDEPTAPLPYTTPYLVISGAMLAGLLALALAAGWWAVVREGQLLARVDNPRRGIAERYVPRGSILDRTGTPIVQTIGEPGDYRRVYEYPPLSDTTGYNSPFYGQAGLEAGLDGHLRGISGSSQLDVWTENLMYGQPPSGLAARLTIDLELQKQADALLRGHAGALVLLNAAKGEILVIASHPNFNPNEIEQAWENLLQDPNAPLLNRATQGQYAPGASLGPFLLAYALAQGPLPDIPPKLTYTTETGTWSCAVQPGLPLTPGRMIASGCPAPLVTLSHQVGTEEMVALFSSLGFYQAPDLPLEMTGPSVQAIDRTDLAAIGQEALTVTPLQMAIAAAALSNQGVRPSPQIVDSLLMTDEGWVDQMEKSGENTLLAGGTTEALAALVPGNGVPGNNAPGNTAYWQTLALAGSSDSEITWYLSGTSPSWKGISYALALVLEENNPRLAEEIGRGLMESITR